MKKSYERSARLTLSIVALSWAAALPLGCGDARDTLDPYGPGGIDATYANAFCSFVFDCCNGAERGQIIGFQDADYSTKDECLEEAGKGFRRAFWAVDDGEAAGRLEWDRDKAQGCVENLEVAASECSAEKYYESTGEGCANADLITGLVEDNDTCYASYECATPGSICEIDTGDEDETIVTARGECEPPLEEGDDCIDEDIGCSPELYCNFVSEECEEFQDVGDNCDDGRECDPNTSFCNFDFDDGFECEALKDNGEECFFGSECKSGICDEEECQGFVQNDDVDIEYEICTGEP